MTEVARLGHSPESCRSGHGPSTDFIAPASRRRRGVARRSSQPRGMTSHLLAAVFNRDDDSRQAPRFTARGFLFVSQPCGNWQRNYGNSGRRHPRTRRQGPGRHDPEELEAAQRAADGEPHDEDPAEEDEEAIDSAAATAAPAATPAPTPAPTPEPTPAPTPQPEASANGGKPEGVLSKDGTRVLPYGALQAARQAAARAEKRAERAEKERDAAQQQIDDLKSGKKPIADLTEQDVIEMEADFPEKGKKLRALWEKAQAAPDKPQAEDDKDERRPRVEDAGADRPGPLAAPVAARGPREVPARHRSGRDLQQVAEVEGQGRPRTLRSCRRSFVADEYGVEYEGPAKPKASTNAPAPAAPAAPAAAPTASRAGRARASRTPETLSDFKHGATPDHGSLDMERASAPQRRCEPNAWT
jgi:hypothetical protein